MKIDLWTKVVFTVIAISLTILAVKSLQVVPIQAADKYMFQGDILKVDLVRIGGDSYSVNDLKTVLRSRVNWLGK